MFEQLSDFFYSIFSKLFTFSYFHRHIYSPKLIFAVDHEPPPNLQRPPLETISNPRVLQLKEKAPLYKYEVMSHAREVKNPSFPVITSKNLSFRQQRPVEHLRYDCRHKRHLHRARDINAITWVWSTMKQWQARNAPIWPIRFEMGSRRAVMDYY